MRCVYIQKNHRWNSCQNNNACWILQVSSRNSKMFSAVYRGFNEQVISQLIVVVIMIKKEELSIFESKEWLK